MDLRIDMEHYPQTIAAICRQNNFAFKITVLLQHFHSFSEVGSIKVCIGRICKGRSA